MALDNSAWLASPDINKVMAEEINNRLQGKVTYQAAIKFSDKLLRDNEAESIDYLYQRVTDKLVAILSDAGYDAGSYRVEFLVLRGNTDVLSSSITARAIVDKSKANKGWVADDKMKLAVERGYPGKMAGLKMMGVDIGDSAGDVTVVATGETLQADYAESPVVNGKMNKTINIHRKIEITEDK